MDQDRQDLGAIGVTPSLLARAHRALDNRVDDLEMRGIEGQSDMHIAARCLHVRREAFMIFDVSRSLEILWIIITLEFLEQVLRRLAKNVDKDIDASPMRHANNNLAHAVLATFLDQPIEYRYEAFSTF